MIKAFFVFRQPFTLIMHYLRETSPASKQVTLKRGLTISLSEHPHDIVTIFVVMVKQEYGKVSPGSVVVDIGANIGSFSLYAAHQGARQIYSYEPNAQAFNIFVQNIKQNAETIPVIVPHRAAVLGSNCSHAVIPSQSSPYNRICTADIASEHHEVVPSTTLERILADNQLEVVDLLKLDCEGAEYDILFQSSAMVMARIREIRMEYHGAEIEGLTSYLRSLGYYITYWRAADHILWVKRF